MRTVRLLPVVVVAAGALLALKTVGLMTNGGYVLTGVGEVQAAGGGSAPEESAGSFTLPQEQTLTDASPTLSDEAPTMGTKAEAEHGGETDAEGGHGGDAPAAEATGHATGSEGAGEGSRSQAAADANCAPGIAPGVEECAPEGDAVPMRIGEDGSLVPLNDTSGVAETERELLERLTERRAELDAYARELELRAALIEATEKRVEERATTMEALEAQIASLVEERKATEQNLIAGVVSMYETMRARDAARIFNDLDLEVLVQVAKAMAPRKMALVLAEMEPARAQELTVRLAAVDRTPPDEFTPEQFSELPQIVGQ